MTSVGAADEAVPLLKGSRCTTAVVFIWTDLGVAHSESSAAHGTMWLRDRVQAGTQHSFVSALEQGAGGKTRANGSILKYTKPQNTRLINLEAILIFVLGIRVYMKRPFMLSASDLTRESFKAQGSAMWTRDRKTYKEI